MGLLKPFSRSDLQTSKLDKNNEIKTLDLNIKNCPSYFGVDRALACFSALNIIKNCNKNILIADFGTILSLTKLNAEGEIIGGQLVPGFLTQLKSMKQNTMNLELPNIEIIPKQDFLFETDLAMIKGVITSLVGTIKQLFNPQEDILIICGGDTKLISTYLNYQKHEMIIDPDLVMKGMMQFKR